MLRRRWPVLLAVPVVLLVLAVGGTWLYLNVLRDDAPDAFSLDDPEIDAEGGARGGASTPAGEGIEGEWRIGAGSAAGYRVPEILLGQSAEAVGRTGKITGSVTITGSTVTAATFTTDMASITSDDSRRDSQFRGRIMDVSAHPTSTFVLTRPIELGGDAAAGGRVEVDAVGRLTMRGTTRTVTIPLEAERRDGAIHVVGSLDVHFDDWGIPNPSSPVARVGDDGVLEVRLVLTR